jgi:hypothetical protein
MTLRATTDEVAEIGESGKTQTATTKEDSVL